MTRNQAQKSYKSVCKQLEALYEASENGGDHIDQNPARLFFYALGGFLGERGIVEALACYHAYMTFCSTAADSNESIN